MAEEAGFHADTGDLRQAPGDVGAALSALRHQKGVTGKALGALVGFSQAKISKVERGALRASPRDVRKIATALDAPADLVAQLVEWAEQAQGDTTARRRGFAARANASQQDVSAQEARATTIWEFEPTVVPGLLQTSEYARSVINGYRLATVTDLSTRWAETAALVSVRTQRQERLYDLSKTFDFMIMESVLGNRLAPPETMLGQVKRIEQVARHPNITIRIVPQTATLELPPLHGFAILDDDLVITESVDATLYRDRRSLDFYRYFFKAYVHHSVTDLDSIIERYKATYASLILPADH